MALYPSTITRLALRRFPGFHPAEKRRFSVSEAVADAHANPKIFKRQMDFFDAPKVPMPVEVPFVPNPVLSQNRLHPDDMQAHLEWINHIHITRSRGFFHRDFLSELTTAELVGMENLYAISGQKLFHQAFINPDWFFNPSGIANYRLLFSLANHIDEPGIREALADLLFDGHQIHAEGALLCILFSLRRKKQNPSILIEWNGGPISYIGVPKTGKPEPMYRSAEIKFDYFDPASNTGHEIKFIKSFHAANRPIQGFYERRLKNQIAKYAAWLAANPNRKFQFDFVGVPNFNLMTFIAQNCPPEYLHRFQVAIYPGFTLDEPIITAPLSDVLKIHEFHFLVGNRLCPIPENFSQDIVPLLEFIHEVKNRIYHTSSFLSQIVPIAERFTYVAEFLRVYGNPELAGSLAPLIDDLALHFRKFETYVSEKKNISDADLSHIHALVGIVLASLRDLLFDNHPDTTLDFIVKAQKLLIVIKYASNLADLDLF